MKNATLKNQSGSASIIAVLFIGLAILSILAVSARQSYNTQQNVGKYRDRLSEKWRARSEANMLGQTARILAPVKLSDDKRLARQLCNVQVTVPIFDAAAITADQSRPAASLNADGAVVCSTSRSPTSIFGSLQNWSNGSKSYFEKEAVTRFGINLEQTRIVSVDEIYRLQIGSATTDVSYAVRIIVESKIGNYRTRTNLETVLGETTSCGTTVEIDANPKTIPFPQSSTITVRYSYANNLRIFDTYGNLIDEKKVAEQSAIQEYQLEVSPGGTTTYYAVAEGSSGGCRATSAQVEIIRTIPPAPLCPRLNFFSSSSPTINAGQTVTLYWQVEEAVRVTLDGETVDAGGGGGGIVIIDDESGGGENPGGASKTFTLTADHTFTLIAYSESGECPITATVTVTVRPAPPSCSFAAPQIPTFAPNPTSIQNGQTTNLAWSVTGLESGGQIRITGPNGFSQNGLPSNGNLTVSPPNAAGDYTYTIIAENVCPDGTRLTTQKTVVVTSSACPPPVFNSYVVEPSTVAVGGNQRINFAWATSGTVDALSISNGVGGGLPANGSVEIMQPQSTTTYTITAVGCGVTKTEQRTVTATSCPSPVINNFASSVPNVVSGGSATVRLSWATAGTVSSLNISGIGAVTGSYVDIPQPQTTTTYVLTAAGCSQNTTAQVTITVTAPPVGGTLKNGGIQWIGNVLSFNAEPLGCNGIFNYESQVTFNFYDSQVTPGMTDFYISRNDLWQGANGSTPFNCPSRTPMIQRYWQESRGWCGRGERRLSGFRDGFPVISVNKNCDVFDYFEKESPTTATVVFYNKFDQPVGSPLVIQFTAFFQDRDYETVTEPVTLPPPPIPAGATQYQARVRMNTIISIYDQEGCGNPTTPTCALSEVQNVYQDEVSPMVPLQ